MSSKPYHVAVITGPRHGGPLRWAKDLTEWINRSGEAKATLIHATSSILRSQLSIHTDIVHSTVPITLRFWRHPLVLTVKGDYSIETPIWRPLYKWAVQHANQVTVPSNYLRRRVRALSQAEIIPNAVDLSRFSVAWPPSSATVRAVMVTNFWYVDKVAGVKTVITTLQAAIKKSAFSVSLTIVGTGKFLPEVKAYAASVGLDVQFTGWIDTTLALSEADIFLYFSNHDNMPNAVLEAMASGLPVLTNRVGAIDEMITSGVDGIIVDTPEQYEAALLRLMNDATLRQQLGQAARKTIEQRFSWSTVVQRYLEIYRKLLL